MLMRLGLRKFRDWGDLLLDLGSDDLCLLLELSVAFLIFLSDLSHS